jgi:hypothetical protein
MAQVSHHLDDSEHGVRASSAVRAWLDIVQLVLIVVLFACGLAFRPGPGHDTWPQHWNAIFLALGFLSLGFGAGMLVYRRTQRSDTVALRADFADLSSRTRLLSQEMDSLLERKRKQDK